MFGEAWRVRKDAWSGQRPGATKEVPWRIEMRGCLAEGGSLFAFSGWSMKSFEPVGKQAQPHLSPEKDTEPTVCAADAVEQINLFNITEKGK
jgi:hypothetical protein